MTDTVLTGRGDTISSIPQTDWEQEVSAAPEKIRRRLAFMTKEYHRVRSFIVRELPRLGRPMTLHDIVDALGIPRTRTSGILDDLERNLFFLVRRGEEEVTWAFPVTVENTGHHLVFSTGERLDAA